MKNNGFKFNFNKKIVAMLMASFVIFASGFFTGRLVPEDSFKVLNLISINKSKEKTNANTSNSQNNTSEKKETLSTEENDKSKLGKYSIEKKDGYIVLYKYDANGKKELLESTKISYEALPKNIQDEIESGFLLDSSDEAYSMLEEISS
ncbi:MAG: hypothetical protein LBR30_03315 [Clostridioides sp.]|nr:hypothetical protein [Clostridioides sp.]